MLKRGMTVKEALKLVRSRRLVAPNHGFLRQLATLDIQLRERRKLVSDVPPEQIINSNESIAESPPCQAQEDKCCSCTEFF